MEKREFYLVISAMKIQENSRKVKHTLLNNWNVLKGSSPDKKDLVIMPLSEEITQLINRSIIPNVVP